MRISLNEKESGDVFRRYL